MRAIPAALAALICAGLFTACPRRTATTPPATPAPTPTPLPVPTPPPPPYAPYKRMEVGRMFSGAQIRTSLETEFGGSATEVRNDLASYEVEVKVRVKIDRKSVV